jgi:hypothetical protein
MKSKHSAALLIALLYGSHGASAADWRFCIAPADAENRIYISMPFPSMGAKAELEFDESLTAGRMRHGSVQCPRADGEASAVIMRQYVIEFCNKVGRKIISSTKGRLPQ